MCKCPSNSCVRQARTEVVSFLASSQTGRRALARSCSNINVHIARRPSLSRLAGYCVTSIEKPCELAQSEALDQCSCQPGSGVELGSQKAPTEGFETLLCRLIEQRVSLTSQAEALPRRTLHTRRSAGFSPSGLPDAFCPIPGPAAGKGKLQLATIAEQQPQDYHSRPNATRAKD